MKLYLSSYKVGNKEKDLLRLAPQKTMGYIPNALDFSKADPERKRSHIEKDMRTLEELGFIVQELDLKTYFGKEQELEVKLRELKAVFISGGNVFVLRQAMKLSGLDNIISKFSKNKEDFLYAGYSAAGCVLSPQLTTYAIVDDATDLPYKEQKEVIFQGLGIIPYAFLPHWDSNHPESKDVAKEIQLCEEKNIPYKAIRDGDVVIVE